MIITDNEKASLWDKKDYLSLSVLLKLIKISDKQKKIQIVRSFEKLLDRIYNDNRTPFEDFSIMPIEVHRADNKVTVDGLTMLTELMAGSAFDVPLFLASGTGSEEVDENQQTLSNENARNSVIDEGWRLSDGNSVKMACRFDPNTPTADIWEFASFDEITAGTMEWRVVLDSKLAHTQGSTFYMCYHSLNLNPR